MKKIGIIGGIGPESTLEYYKRIVYGYRKNTGDENYPQVFINSINMNEMMNCLKKNDYDELTRLLIREIRKLEQIGAEYVAMASNTPHCVVGELKAKCSVPIISIVEETCNYAQKSNLKKLLLTGTIFTMKNTFYQKALETCGIKCIVPDDEGKDAIYGIIFPNLENGIIIEKDKLAFKEICEKIIAEENVDGIILGCTELPLLVNQSDFAVKVLDTMEIHINGILKRIIG